MNKVNVIQLIKEGYKFRFIAKLMSRKQDPETLLPSKECLLASYKEQRSFKTIAGSMDVPEKVVKKWFKTQGLPTTLKEMNKIIGI